MAVTNYEKRDNSVYGGPTTSGKVQTGFGNGTPVGDADMEDDVAQPIGSQYTDLDDGKIYTKTASATWTDSSAA